MTQDIAIDYAKYSPQANKSNFLNAYSLLLIFGLPRESKLRMFAYLCSTKFHIIFKPKSDVILLL